jgi:two-component system, LuxR family, sensor kinase FixL
MQNGMPNDGIFHTAFNAMIVWCRAHEHRAGAREALLTSAQMRETLEVVPVAILGIDKTGKITFINERARKLFGYRSSDLTGACASLLIPEWRAQGSHATAAKLPTAGTPAAALLHAAIARRQDGGEFAAEVTTSPCRVDGVPIRLAVVVERRECNESNESHRDRLELAHLARISSLGELAGSLAHELNQPLTAILSNSQAAQRFMEADPIDVSEVREILEDIVADNRRAAEIIRKMRALARKSELEWQSVDVGGLVNDVISLVHSDAIVRGVRAISDIAPALPAVRGDKVQLQQVLLNLILNAFDAVRERPAVDRLVTVQASAEPDGAVRLCVRDRGHGLTVEMKDMIFQPFFTSKPHGLGLGLSISRSIVGAHGGHIWGENNAEGGAAFHVLLPSVQAPASRYARAQP